MEKNKRILIISPDKNREYIAMAVESHLEKKFPNYSRDIEIQSYPTFHSAPEREQLGHWGRKGIGEILVIYDQRFVPKEKRIKAIKGTNFVDLLRASYQTSINLCKVLKIPCILYQGELEKGKPEELERKLDAADEQIKQRLKPAV